MPFRPKPRIRRSCNTVEKEKNVSLETFLKRKKNKKNKKKIPLQKSSSPKSKKPAFLQ